MKMIASGLLADLVGARRFATFTPTGTYMTFTEAAIEVLRREGKPLHFKKIAEIAIRESLLDHVGKIPDDTMADQLVAHCRLPHPDRRLIPIQSGTFALVEWEMDEDPAGAGEPHRGSPRGRARLSRPRAPSGAVARGRPGPRTGRGPPPP